MNDTIVTDARFSAAQTELVAFVAGAIIPQDVQRGMPAANNAEILHDILRSASAVELPAFCVHVETQTQTLFGCSFQHAAAEQRSSLMKHLAGSNHVVTRGFVSLVVQCYFRDAQVLMALGLEPRAPFPKGHQVAAGEWDLLENVKRRAPFYRRPDA